MADVQELKKRMESRITPLLKQGDIRAASAEISRTLKHIRASCESEFTELTRLQQEFGPLLIQYSTVKWSLLGDAAASRGTDRPGTFAGMGRCWPPVTGSAGRNHAKCEIRKGPAIVSRRRGYVIEARI